MIYMALLYCSGHNNTEVWKITKLPVSVKRNRNIGADLKSLFGFCPLVSPVMLGKCPLANQEVSILCSSTMLIYRCETCVLKAEDICRLLVFDHRRLLSISQFFWNYWVTNVKVRRRIQGEYGWSIDGVANLCRVILSILNLLYYHRYYSA